MTSEKYDALEKLFVFLNPKKKQKSENNSLDRTLINLSI
jgi:hypothetical protein